MTVQAEVGHLQMPLLIKQYVTGTQVAVHNISVMGGLHRATQLDGNLDEVDLRVRARQAFLQAATG